MVRFYNLDVIVNGNRVFPQSRMSMKLKIEAVGAIVFFQGYINYNTEVSYIIMMSDTPMNVTDCNG